MELSYDGHGLTDLKYFQKKTIAIGSPSSKPAAITCSDKDQWNLIIARVV